MAKTQDATETVKIKLAFLHQALTWPGVAGSEKTISAARIPGVIMSITQHGLMLECKGKSCLVPHTNVVNYVLA